MNPKLVVLSDLWGKEKADWWPLYQQLLENHFRVQFYDSCELGNVTTENCDESALHQQFVGGGIARAAEKLTAYEPEPVHLLAFSVGGTIGWQAALQGLRIQQFAAVSATRLRHETQRIPGSIDLFYGQEDAYRPSLEWCEKMNVAPVLFPQVGHLCYTSPETAATVAEALLEASSLAGSSKRALD